MRRRRRKRVDHWAMGRPRMPRRCQEPSCTKVDEEALQPLEMRGERALPRGKPRQRTSCRCRRRWAWAVPQQQEEQKQKQKQKEPLAAMQRVSVPD